NRLEICNLVAIYRAYLAVVLGTCEGGTRTSAQNVQSNALTHGIGNPLTRSHRSSFTQTTASLVTVGPARGAPRCIQSPTVLKHHGAIPRNLPRPVVIGLVHRYL